MNRRLIVMRHAKSDWHAGAATDHARPLNHRGRRDAPRIAQRIVELGWEPEVVLSSDSTRTRETYELMAQHFAESVIVHYLESLYHAGPRELVEALQLLPDEVQTVMALGHNPGWSAVMYWLTENDVSLTTANAALCHVEAGSWGEAAELGGIWQLEDVLRPKEL